MLTILSPVNSAVLSLASASARGRSVAEASVDVVTVWWERLKTDCRYCGVAVCKINIFRYVVCVRMVGRSDIVWKHKRHAYESEEVY